MVPVLVCFSMAFLLYSSSADGNPTEMYEMEGFFPKEKPISRQLPQNYWYTPRLGKRDREELGFEYDLDDPVSFEMEKRAHNERKFNPIFIPRTGKRADAIFRLFPPPQAQHSGDQVHQATLRE